jgi:hypothetical protein
MQIHIFLNKINSGIAASKEVYDIRIDRIYTS